jgi:hypothetical protein
MVLLPLKKSQYYRDATNISKTVDSSFSKEMVVQLFFVLHQISTPYPCLVIASHLLWSSYLSCGRYIRVEIKLQAHLNRVFFFLDPPT